MRRRSSHSYGDWSPLLFACREGIISLCKILLARGADINQKDMDKLSPGYTPLLSAATRGDFDMVKMLVEAGADIYMGDRNGKTGQLLAEQRGFEAIGEYLKEQLHPNAEQARRRGRRRCG